MNSGGAWPLVLERSPQHCHSIGFVYEVGGALSDMILYDSPKSYTQKP